MSTGRSFWKGIQSYFSGEDDTHTPAPSQKLRLSGRGTRIPLQGSPVFEVEMGKQRLHLYPDLKMDEAHRGPGCDFMLFDPERYYAGIGHFLGLRSGQTLEISKKADFQKLLFSSPRDAFRRHFSVRHDGDGIVFRDTISELGTYVTLLGDADAFPRLLDRRRVALEATVDLFGGPVRLLPDDDALQTLKDVNHALREEAYRRKDAEGNPGGVVELPEDLIPVLVGDLHAQVDNLLKILSVNGFMEGLMHGDAALIFLGDAVHCEADGKLDDMDQSFLMMDLILKLKLRFPAQVFFVVGNHDSFSPDVMKGGVPQSLIWEKRIVELRGKAYRDELATFYQQSPLVILSKDFVACHAGPTRAKVSRKMLVNIRQYPGLVHELTWTRLRTPGIPAGYTRGDVRRFRNSLGLEKDTPFIVGHYPFAQDETVWLNVGDITGHHILYSARQDQVGIFTRIDGEMVPQVYTAEPLLGWVNAQAGG